MHRMIPKIDTMTLCRKAFSVSFSSFFSSISNKFFKSVPPLGFMILRPVILPMIYADRKAPIGEKLSAGAARYFRQSKGRNEFMPFDRRPTPRGWGAFVNYFTVAFAVLPVTRVATFSAVMATPPRVQFSRVTAARASILNPASKVQPTNSVGA